jgi:hypothetical protein
MTARRPAYGTALQLDFAHDPDVARRPIEQPKPRKKRAPKPKPPTSHYAHRAVILAIDTAKQSGWAIFTPGQYAESGEANIEDRVELERITARAMKIALACDMPCILVLEKPWRSGFASTYTGLGAARFAWMQAWKAAGFTERRVVRVHPQTWRSKVLGRSRRNESEPKDAIAILEQRYAKATAGRDVGPDEAAAIGLGVYATRAGEVVAKLPKSAAGRRLGT